MMDIMEAYKSIAVKKHIDFRLINRQPGIKAWFDQYLFDRVLYNLLSNAFKFTPQQGKVVLEIQQVQQVRRVVILREVIKQQQVAVKVQVQ